MWYYESRRQADSAEFVTAALIIEPTFGVRETDAVSGADFHSKGLPEDSAQGLREALGHPPVYYRFNSKLWNGPRGNLSPAFQ